MAESRASFVGRTQFCHLFGNSLFKAPVVMLVQTHALSIMQFVITSNSRMEQRGEVVGTWPGKGCEGSSTFAKLKLGMSVV